MSDTDPEPKVSDSDLAGTEASRPQDNRADAVIPRQKRSKLALLAIALALISGAGVAYVYWFQLQDSSASVLSDITERQQGLLAQVNAIERGAGESVELLSSLRSRQKELETQLRYSLDKSLALEARLAELSHTDRSDWQLAEVEYLLRLAHQRVLDTQNAAVGVELLNAADELLREIDSADLYAIRQQIADDRFALQNASHVDVEGLYMRLNALTTQLGKLVLTQTPALPDTQAQATEAASNSLISVWQSLLSLYRVQVRDPDIKPLLTLGQQVQLQMRAALLLDQAKLALLRARVSVYQAALTSAADLLRQLDIAPPMREVFEDEVNFLLAQNIEVNMPDISASHTMMKRYIRTRRLVDDVSSESPETAL